MSRVAAVGRLTSDGQRKTLLLQIVRAPQKGKSGDHEQEGTGGVNEPGAGTSTGAGAVRRRARRLVLRILLLGFVALLPGSLTASASRFAPLAVTSQPNIVVIVADDQAALDGRLVDFMPNANAIFKNQGITFTDFHSSSPLCCPGRANLLTGQYTHNHLVVSNSAKLFKPAMSLATQLDGAGYFTALVGKYFNQYSAIAPVKPPGWDRFSAFGDAKYYSYTLWNDGNPVGEVHGTTAADYSTDVLRQRAVDIINAAPATQPLFLWLAPNAPHPPTSEAAPRYKTAPCTPPRWFPPNYDEADVSDKPAYIPGHGADRRNRQGPDGALPASARGRRHGRCRA